MINKRTFCAVATALLLGLSLGSGLAQENKEISLTLEDSILRALKNNLNVAAEVINPGLTSATVSQARQMYAPTIEIGLTGNRLEQLSTWSLQSAGSYVNRSTSTSAAITQRIPFGGTLQAGLSYDYSYSPNELFQSYNPSYTSRLNLVLKQPLLKNFGWTVSRKEIIIAQNNFEVSRSQFRDTLVATVYSVESAYWNLVYSIESLKTLRLSLDSGKDLLAKTKREVQVGTKAPIEVLNAEATVARREADILQAEALVKRSQDQLRTLLNIEVDPSARGLALVPADKPEFKPYTITLEEALAKAMTHRPDLDVAKSTIALKQVNFRVAKNQRLPQLDLQLVKASPGISGQQYIYDENNPFLPPTPGDPGSAGAAFRDAFKFLYNNWTAGVTLTVPFGDVFGKAQYAYAKLDLEQAQARLKTQEQQVFLEVSDAVRSLETAAKSVDAYRIARELAEKQLEAEMKKLNVGMSTNYFVLTYQDALASARSMEIKALVDYNVAVANIAKATGSTLEDRGITLSDYIK
ncbi:MAG TPA: TolC family protein [Candidatus Aminicenantes bacterium]|nr:TolC family protein [Candidatus Aminicenantes bacterium]HRY63956.1 TolC family protein [Candidatus Aminicenantes bacterium]HRZ70869.1 TolC family protein [Candidatus Aminicenantes bacterium]